MKGHFDCSKVGLDFVCWLRMQSRMNKYCGRNGKLPIRWLNKIQGGDTV